MRLKRYNEAVASKVVELIKRKEEFETEYQIEDIKNWTSIIEDIDGVENFKIGEIDLLKLRRMYRFDPEPGYYIRFEISIHRDSFDDEYFKNELKVLRKMLYNNGLDIIGLEEAGEKDYLTLNSIITEPIKSNDYTFLIKRKRN